MANDSAEMEGAKVEDTLHYQMKINGRIDENDLNVMGPFPMTVERVEAKFTTFSVDTDQSGLIGLIRRLYGRGIFLVSVQCEPSATRENALHDDNRK